MTATRPCLCDRFAPARPFRPDRDCAPCWLFAHRPEVRAAWGGVAPDEPAREARELPPRAFTAVGPAGLTTSPGGYAFNAGLIRHAGHLLMCYRVGWAGSDVHVAVLADALTPVRSVRLDLGHRRAGFGREDPRLFVHRGRLHVSFTGFEVTPPRGMRTSVLYARLSDDLRVEEVFYPDYSRRSYPHEKNWVFFDHDGDLYCVYSIEPHVVLRVDGNRAETAHESDTPFAWSGGHLRGGASPVRVGDRWYHWFHGRRDADTSYNVGCYAFDARPPFRVLAMTPHPVLWADPADNARHPHPNYAAVAFPGGAVLEGGVWRVAMGWNDRGIRVAEWDAAAVDATLAGRVGSPSND